MYLHIYIDNIELYMIMVYTIIICVYIYIPLLYTIPYIPLLAGGILTPLKNMKVNRDDDIPNIWKNKKCSKPPTSSIAIEIGPVEIVDLSNYKMVDLSIVFCM